MTPEESKQIYKSACLSEEIVHCGAEWQQIHEAMEKIVAAKTDRTAAKYIDWWSCWDRKYTSAGFARRVRKAYNALNNINPDDSPSYTFKQQCYVDGKLDAHIVGFKIDGQTFTLDGYQETAADAEKLQNKLDKALNKLSRV